ncbi:MAG: type I-A CRISPR-associated protein Cas4/Csa1 [candidate division WOR-3 bacterium]
MPLVTMSSLMELSRRMRRIKPCVDEELRGWNWHQPPLLHAYPSVNLPISEIYNETCRCGALIHLKYNLKCSPTLRYPADGKIAHHLWTRFYTHLQKSAANAATPTQLAHQLIEAAEQEKQALLTEFGGQQDHNYLSLRLDRWIEALWHPMTHLAVAEYVKLLTAPGGPQPETITSWLSPMAVELKVDGSLLGFSSGCRVDGLAPLGLVVELKTSKPAQIHELALAAYALAIESQFETPIDYGMLLYLNLRRNRPICTTYVKLVALENKLRLDSLEERDRMSKIVADGVFTEPSKQCTHLCPLNEVAKINE